MQEVAKVVVAKVAMFGIKPNPDYKPGGVDNFWMMEVPKQEIVRGPDSPQAPRMGGGQRRRDGSLGRMMTAVMYEVCAG